ncbi:ShET2/EspL2 family type III secretion system effector toxin [Pseudochelatococcus sp. B33]
MTGRISGSALPLSNLNGSERSFDDKRGGSSAAQSRQHWYVQFASDAMSVTGRITDKSIPHFSLDTNNLWENLNSKSFTDDRTPITCRHLAAQYVISSRENIFDWVSPRALFGTTEKIRKVVGKQGSDIESKWRKERENAAGGYIVANNRFGHHLYQWAKDLEPWDRKQFLLMSGNHAMAFELTRLLQSL